MSVEFEFVLIFTKLSELIPPLQDSPAVHDALAGEMEGCRLNAALFGMTGSGKSALINTIFRSLGITLEPAVTQSTGKEGTTILDSYVVPGTQFTLYDTRGFFELDKAEEGNFFTSENF